MGMTVNIRYKCFEFHTTSDGCFAQFSAVYMKSDGIKLFLCCF